jgi:alpha-1,2-mannosyltransferase
MYGPSPATEIPVGEHATRQFWNMNPPHFHLLMLPLARLEPLAALLVWALLNAAALVWSLWRVVRELGLRWTPAGVLWTTLAIASCSATGMILVTGQLTFLLLLPVTFSWIAARRGELVRAGVYLGLVASVKPFMGIFLIYWLVRRQWRGAAAMMVAGLAVGAVGVAVFGLGTYETWIRALRQVEWSWAPMNASITGIVARALGPSPFFEPLRMAPAAIPIVSAILSTCAGILTFGLLAADRTSAATDRAYAGLVAAALLISPLGWAYYVPLLTGPAVALAVGARGRPSTIRRVLTIGAIPGLVLPSLLTSAWTGTPLSGVTLGSVYGWTLLFIWGSVLADAAAAAFAKPRR